MGTNTILGRKRTAGGVLIEVRAIGAIPAEEVTAYVQALLDATEVIEVELRLRREAFERARRQLSLYKPCTCADCEALQERGQ